VLRCSSAQEEIWGTDAHTTNNRMELQAVIAGLSALEEPCSVRVVTLCVRTHKVTSVTAVVMWLPASICRLLVDGGGLVKHIRRTEQALFNETAANPFLKTNLHHGERLRTGPCGQRPNFSWKPKSPREWRLGGGVVFYDEYCWRQRLFRKSIRSLS
jgi:hypothetical protein